MLCTTKTESIGQYDIKGKTEEISLKQNMLGACQSPEKTKNICNFFLFFFPFSVKRVQN